METRLGQTDLVGLIVGDNRFRNKSVVLYLFNVDYLLLSFLFYIFANNYEYVQLTNEV